MGPVFSVSFPPPDRVWLKVTAVIPYPAARAAAAATTAALSAAGFLFHSLLFLGILCSIKPFACNTAGSAPSRSLLRSFLSSSLPSVFPGLHPTPSSSLPCPPLTSGISDPSLPPPLAKVCREGSSMPTFQEKNPGRAAGPTRRAPPTTPGRAGGPSRAPAGVTMPDWFCWFQWPALGGACTRGRLWGTMIFHLDSCHLPAHRLER